jgi:hypothetical protein
MAFYAQTFVPSVQLVQISISFLERNMADLKPLYAAPCQTFSKESMLTSPNLWVASLSKQQGTTKPSQVITLPRHKRQHWFSNSFFIS